MGDSPSSDSGSNNESRMSPGRATAQFGSEVGSLAGGYTESQVQDAIDQNDSSDSPRTNVEIAREAPVPGTFTQQSQNYVDDFSGANIGSLPTSRSTSTAALPSSFPTDFTKDYSDFNFANSDAAQSLRQGAEGAGIPSIIPFSGAINALTGLPSRMKLNALNRGEVPTYNADGQIIGTTGQGFGMASPDGLLKGYEPFSPVIPTTNVNMNMGGDDSGDNNQQTIIRRNPSDPVQDDPTDPVITDELASDYLQNPFYLYSGMGNQYQPYGYAANTLVNLLRTRNMTQPQQAAANLGLFGNPGDFS
ncbi:hypothetical protein OAM56_08925 [Alphaproteobacteria bacterium]|nr:hypothetical protein [Alphaproteobacteria bacterium]